MSSESSPIEQNNDDNPHRYDANLYFYNHNMIDDDVKHDNSNIDCIWRSEELKFHTDEEIRNEVPDEILVQTKEEMKSTLDHFLSLDFDDQKSIDWLKVRKEVITATGYSCVLGMNPYERDIRNFYIDKAGNEIKQITGAAMAWGNKYEEVANQVYSERNKVKVYEFGMIRHKEIAYYGASPDGIGDHMVMLEIKCVKSRKITGIPTKYYYLQTQLQMECCNFERCDFMECKFIEYSSVEEYIQDTDPNDPTKTANGMEKGAVITFQLGNDFNNLLHKYPPLGISPEEASEFMIEQLRYVHENVDKDYTAPNISFWRLDHVSCVPIFRDRHLFEYNKPMAEKIWNKVEYYKENGIEDLINEIETEKWKRQQSKKPYNKHNAPKYKQYISELHTNEEISKSNDNVNVDDLTSKFKKMSIKKTKKIKANNMKRRTYYYNEEMMNDIMNQSDSDSDKSNNLLDFNDFGIKKKPKKIKLKYRTLRSESTSQTNLKNMINDMNQISNDFGSTKSKKKKLKIKPPSNTNTRFLQSNKKKSKSKSKK